MITASALHKQSKNHVCKCSIQGSIESIEGSVKTRSIIPSSTKTACFDPVVLYSFNISSSISSSSSSC